MAAETVSVQRAQATEWETPADYGLCSERSQEAIERGYAEAEWYQSPLDREQMQRLLERRNWPAIRDSLIWFGLLIGCATAGVLLWGSWWAVLPFAVYGMIYGGSADSRWHESSHGTAFKTDWMNNVLYEIASFMVMRESTLWRWSHTRHHSDTIIVGRDPEIASPRPPSYLNVLLGFFGIPQARSYVNKVVYHCLGQLHDDEKSFVPKSDWGKVVWTARVHVFIYLCVAASAIYFNSWLPLVLIGLPSLYGAWLMPVYGLTQHAGLAENVLDHRLNCRTVRMNIINRFLYWNMNYHIEHHMYPLVPYHQLPKLHELIKDDTPAAYTSIYAAWKEIIYALRHQKKDPTFYVKRPLPASQDTAPAEEQEQQLETNADGWFRVCSSAALDTESVRRFDIDDKTFAIYRTADGSCHATAGMCTHGKMHLAEGLVRGNQIECPKHNGRFDVRDGSPQRPPVCKALQCFEVREIDEELFLDPAAATARTGCQRKSA